MAADGVVGRGAVDGTAAARLVLASTGRGFDVIGGDGSRGTERAGTRVLWRRFDSGEASDRLGDGVMETLAEGLEFSAHSAPLAGGLLTACHAQTCPAQS